MSTSGTEANHEDICVELGGVNGSERRPAPTAETRPTPEDIPSSPTESKQQGTSCPVKECRICLTTDNQNDIVEPCRCTGTVQYAHLECLRSWCVENLSLKCEICGSVYKDEVVNALMSTLIEAQDRQVAQQGLADDTGIRLDYLDHGTRREYSRPAVQILRPHGASGQTSEEAQQRMQAFLEELLQVYASRSEQMLARHNRGSFSSGQDTNPRCATAAYTCAAALLLLWMLLFVVLSRVDNSVLTGATAGLGGIVVLVFASVYLCGRWVSHSSRAQQEAPFGRAAREVERRRAIEQAQRQFSLATNISIVR